MLPESSLRAPTNIILFAAMKGLQLVEPEVHEYQMQKKQLQFLFAI